MLPLLLCSYSKKGWLQKQIDSSMLNKRFQIQCRQTTFCWEFDDSNNQINQKPCDEDVAKQKWVFAADGDRYLISPDVNKELFVCLPIGTTTILVSTNKDRFCRFILPKVSRDGVDYVNFQIPDRGQLSIDVTSVNEGTYLKAYGRHDGDNQIFKVDPEISAGILNRLINTFVNIRSHSSLLCLEIGSDQFANVQRCDGSNKNQKFKFLKVNGQSLTYTIENEAYPGKVLTPLTVAERSKLTMIAETGNSNWRITTTSWDRDRIYRIFCIYLGGNEICLDLNQDRSGGLTTMWWKHNGNNQHWFLEENWPALKTPEECKGICRGGYGNEEGVYCLGGCCKVGYCYDTLLVKLCKRPKNIPGCEGVNFSY